MKNDTKSCKEFLSKTFWSTYSRYWKRISKKECGASTFREFEYHGFKVIVQYVEDQGFFLSLGLPEELKTINVEEQLISFAKTIRHCGDYGRLFWNEKTGHVWLVLGDSDGETEYGYSDFTYIENGFKKIPGVKSVDIEGESFPYDEDSDGDSVLSSGYKDLGRHGIEVYDGKEHPIKS